MHIIDWVSLNFATLCLTLFLWYLQSVCPVNLNHTYCVPGQSESHLVDPKYVSGHDRIARLVIYAVFNSVRELSDVVLFIAACGMSPETSGGSTGAY